MVSLITAPVYTLKITLLGTEPPVWRQVIVRGDILLEELHYVIQIAMGWTNSHLHQYFVGNVRYGVPDPEFGNNMKDEADFTQSRSRRLQRQSPITNTQSVRMALATVPPKMWAGFGDTANWLKRCQTQSMSAGGNSSSGLVNRSIPKLST